MSTGILTLIVLLCGLGLWFLAPFALRKLETQRLDRLCRQNRAVVLTYDDGPTQGVSDEVLEVLAEQNAPATFFVIGRQAVEQPDLITRLQQGGHEVANHTHAHSNAWKVPPWTANRDIAAGQKTLAKLGVTSRVFRPPYGKTTLASLVFRVLNRLRFAYWTIDTQDSWDRRPIPDILAEIERNGGGVILMHDFGQPRRGPEPQEHLDYVLKATREIINFARKNNMELQRFSDLASGRGPGKAAA
ncbi:MAG: polysaccharide deacetylase family protein [Sedimentitalea sp.]